MERIDAETWRNLWPGLLVYVKNMSSAFKGDAEDLAADIFLKALEASGSYDSRRPFRTWFFSIAHNHCVDELRRRSREPAAGEFREAQAAAGTACGAAGPSAAKAAAAVQDYGRSLDGPEEQLLRSEEATAVREYLSGLSVSDREIAFLRFYEELGHRQIAGIIGKPVGTVKYRVHIIKKGLKAFWRNRYEEESRPKRTPALDPGLLP